MHELYLLFLLLSLLLFSGLKLLSAFRKKQHCPDLNLTDLSAVIPFRNEALTLTKFLASLKIQSILPAKIIFVNDHSEDDSVQIIEQFINKYGLGTLIHLPQGEAGKKAALNLGITNVETPFVLTLDADIIFNEDYFDSLSSLPAVGLHSLPVTMQGKGFLQKLFSTEYSFFNAFNFLLSSIRPISVSGANLLFDRNAINYQKQLKKHKHLASGDDYFLLKEFRRKHLPVYISNETKLCVTSSAPDSIASYLDQRVRWLSKSNHQLTGVDVLIGVFITVYFLGGLIVLAYSVLTCSWIALLSTFIIRFMIDAVVYFNYAQGLGKTKGVLMLPFFQLIYPLLFLTVATLSLFYKPRWKGRS